MDNERKVLLKNFEYYLLPAPCSIAIKDLITQQNEYGTGSIAAEIASAIEVWFQMVAMLLFAEYLNAGAPDGELNRHLFKAMDSKRKMFLGSWVAIARGCRKALETIWAQGRAPAWPGMKNLEFGDPTDHKHPVTRLVNYRNNFSHGAFLQKDDAIINHGQLLAKQINLLANDLFRIPIRFVLSDGSVGVLQGNCEDEMAHNLVNELAPETLSPYTAYVQLESGEVRVLAPVVQILFKNNVWELTFGQLGNSHDNAFIQKFSASLDRYRREPRGYLTFTGEQVPLESDPTPHAIEGFDNAIVRGQVLNLVYYRPGTGEKRTAARILHTMKGKTTKAVVWCVIPDHPSSSGTIFIRFLLRQAESVLHLEEGELEPNKKSLRECINDAAALLQDNEKTVGVVLLNASIGNEKSPGEVLSVIDACGLTSTDYSGYRIVLMSYPTFGTPILHDGEIYNVPIPQHDSIDRKELDDSLNKWKSSNTEIRLQLMRWVLKGKMKEPASVGAAVLKIENQLGKETFCPIIEHALWEAAPFLERTQHDNGNIAYFPAEGDKGQYILALQSSPSINPKVVSIQRWLHEKRNK